MTVIESQEAPTIYDAIQFNGCEDCGKVNELIPEPYTGKFLTWFDNTCEGGVVNPGSSRLRTQFYQGYWIIRRRGSDAITAMSDQAFRQCYQEYPEVQP